MLGKIAAPHEKTPAAGFIWRTFEIPGVPMPMNACVLATMPANELIATLPTDQMLAFLTGDEWRNGWGTNRRPRRG